MDLTRRRLILLLPAAALAWEHVLAGTPEASPNYKLTEHWWSMLIDIPKCIGCGNCVRACQTENDVPDGYFRTWIERYHVEDWGMENPSSIRPTAAKTVSLRANTLVARTSSFRNFAITARSLRVPRCVRSARPLLLPTASCWSTKILPRLPLLCAGLSVRMPLHSSQDKYRREMHALLSPHHQGAHDCVLRSLPDGSTATGGLEESQRSDPRVPAHP